MAILHVGGVNLMKKIINAAYFFIFVFFAGLCSAQEESTDASYVYATYFICTPDGESRADEIISSSFKPHYDAAVEHGDIQGWSWLQHYVGGKWRRVLVIIAGDISSLLDASGALGEIISDKTPEAGRAFSASVPPTTTTSGKPRRVLAAPL